MNPARTPSPPLGEARRLGGGPPLGARLRGAAPAKRQRGASLIEVLVAFLLLTFGLLGMSAMQINALQNNHSALQRSQASMLAHFKMDAMRANRQAAIDGDYNLGALGTPGPPATPDVTVFTPPADTSLVTHDQRTWLLAMRATLGDTDFTQGLVVCEALPPPPGIANPITATCTVRVYWDDTRGTGGAESQMVEIVSQL
ncbi:Tfp pilus assembly protein PilV [Serpentinimonas maccroryi]|uniref:Tfp pilus assembly protein PilV n=1 Tax=Serpentinimonas maccroryi TaxID=1458426 RepID=A0A060NT27_9BURK|nr:type IV pilus modification protein PilV [Serpentinimonas maccroryi]BAO82693.1 Tfp pilus assembly protein PilV [Serpentinimonas maccroryi]